jgi:hypothetical protein
MSHVRASPQLSQLVALLSAWFKHSGVPLKTRIESVRNEAWPIAANIPIARGRHRVLALSTTRLL